MTKKVFLLPDVGEGLVEAEIVAWKVKVGDVVILNQPLVDIETAKAMVELPSPFAGVVSELHGSQGDTIQVDEPLITFDVEGDEAETIAEEQQAADSVGSGREAVLIGYGVAKEEAVVARTRRRNAPETAPSAARTQVRTTPPVRLYAKQHGIDLNTIAGTGRDGVITRSDVDSARTPVAPLKQLTSSGANKTSRFVGRELEPWSSGPLEERIPVKGVLKSMSEAMTSSAFSQPRAAVWVRIDATKTMELVASLKRHPNMQDVRLSPLVIVALGLCDAARHYPGINSYFDMKTSEVVVRRTVNLGIAANTDRGLIVPNIKQADQLDLVGMARALNVLVEKARNGTTTPNEMLGTSLTITNVGPFGVDAAIPIIPPGSGAIIAIGQIAPAPWVVDNQVVVRQVCEIAMSFDHRQIDGALASIVLNHLGRFLSDPATSLLAN